MLNKTSYLVIFTIGMSFLLVSCERKQEVPALVRLEKRYPEIQKKYVYQSLIRLANVDKDQDFEKLIKDLRKVILYLPPKEDSTYQVTAVRNEIREDGFEELVDIRTEDAQRISLFVKEYPGTSHYLAFVDSETDDIILEVDGEIHAEYLASLAKANQSSLMELLKGGF